MKRTMFLLLLLTFSISTLPRVTLKERSIFIILINSYDQLFVENGVMDIKYLKDAIKEFISNPNNDHYSAEMKEVDIPLLGKTLVSRGIVSLQCDRSTTYQKYIDVQNEIEKAYNELRNELALAKFNTHYKRLSKEKQSAINWAIPKLISEPQLRRLGN